MSAIRGDGICETALEIECFERHFNPLEVDERGKEWHKRVNK